MNKIFKWPKNFSSGFFYEKIVIFSLLFLLIVLSLASYFQNLPISGYGLIVINLILIGCTTFIICHGIKWIINSNKPLLFYFREKSENEKWLKLVIKYENRIFEKLFSGENKTFDAFKYPTNLNEQICLLIKDIERDFVKTWYSEISQNPSFLFDSHLILEELFFKIIKKLKTVSCKSVILSTLILYLNHLQEYKKSVKKMIRLNDSESKPKIELPDLCRYSHPGSQSDQLLNYYLKKVTKSLLKEFASHDFTMTLECKILAGIISRKVFRRLLTTVEDPDWINLKLIYLLNFEKHKETLQGKVYSVKEKAVVQDEEEEEFHIMKPTLLSKRYLSSNLFENNRSLFDRNKFHGENSAKAEKKEQKPKLPDKELLTLPLYNEKTLQEDAKGNISTVLSGLISSTAGPLLPDNISVRYRAFNKMWQSPISEVRKDISESISNSFHKVLDGMKDKKEIFKSKSTESLAEIPGSLKSKDVFVREELCENIRFGSPEVKNGSQKLKKLIKTRSFDNDSLLTEDESDDKIASEETKSPSPDNQRDVSPVYEEPEDFATTIAKLRSLLQQRESNSTLSDKSSMSVDSTGFSMDSSSNKSQSLEGDPFDSQMACDIPTDGRPFINVCIPKGELVTDSSGSPYVLYTIQYDGIYMLKDERNPCSDSELVLQTTFVKRRFQDFLQLQAKLEENSSCKPFMKGIKGPSKWALINFGGRNDDSTAPSRRLMLESFLKQLCSKTEISNSPELHEFLGYSYSGNDAVVKKDSDSSLQRIDKLLANKVTGVFNSIKTALPSFDFDSAALVATNDTVKSFQEQKLLQNFLNFGNKSEPFELNLAFVVKEPTGESLTDDIRRYLSEKSDCIEDAVDVLDSNDWLSEQRECRFISAEGQCVWQEHKDVVLEDELEPPDSWFPVYSLLIDIFCELLQDSDSWVIKEPVIRFVKVVSGHWEENVQKYLSNLDWDRIFANVIRLLRGAIFHEEEDIEYASVNDIETKTILKEVILNFIPGSVTQIVHPDGLSSAVSLFVDSFQYLRLNRDVLLRLMDILLTHLLSCHHLTADLRRYMDTPPTGVAGFAKSFVPAPGEIYYRTLLDETVQDKHKVRCRTKAKMCTVTTCFQRLLRFVINRPQRKTSSEVQGESLERTRQKLQ